MTILLGPDARSEDGRPRIATNPVEVVHRIAVKIMRTTRARATFRLRPPEGSILTPSDILHDRPNKVFSRANFYPPMLAIFPDDRSARTGGLAENIALVEQNDLWRVEQCRRGRGDFLAVNRLPNEPADRAVCLTGVSVPHGARSHTVAVRRVIARRSTEVENG
jgi:hypothetical protein